MLSVGAPVVAQQVRYSTHDWLEPQTGLGTPDRNEAWVDVKSPGDGRAYKVGTVRIREVKDELNPSPTLFSNSPAYPSAGTFPINLNGVHRQVVIVQVTDPNQGILFQRFFYGTNPTPALPVNARGISVWPVRNATGELDESNTRVVICGECRDDALPHSQAPGITTNPYKGYIAVYDGSLQLLWTHHFYGNSTRFGHIAITDVSVRIEGNEDVVTYCGISSGGLAAPGTNEQAEAVLPFQAPTGCSTAASGATDNGADNWDGIVGRLRNSHATPTTNGGSNATVDFHCNVGGELQDGLFGIAEIDADRFAVVGSTGQSPSTTVSFSGRGFPFTTTCPPVPMPPNYDFAQGVFLVFNAAGTRYSTPQPLDIEVSRPIGDDPSQPVHTVLRDVVVQRGFQYDVDPSASIATAQDLVLVAGSTDDPNLLLATLAVAMPRPQLIHGGQTDGILLALSNTPGNPWVTPPWGTYRGGPGQDGLVGIQSWNEHLDHISVVGFADSDNTALPNIDVASYHIDTSLAQFDAFGPELKVTRETRTGGSAGERPAAIGVQAATLSNTSNIVGKEFVDFGLGDPAGGGVAVDSRGRIDVVGATEDPGAGTGYPTAGGRLFVADQDAVRSSIDMLPNGVGRTDGTGAPVPSGGPTLPMAGFFGGSTPECALDPYGNRIGTAQPPLRSMLIDYEGSPPASGVSNAVILLSRLPQNHSVHLMALHLGFPGFQPGPPPVFNPFVLVPEGVIQWTTNSPLTSFRLDPPDRSARFPLFALPASLTMTVQAFGLLSGPVPGGNLGPVCSNPSGSLLYASPAIWINY